MVFFPPGALPRAILSSPFRAIMQVQGAWGRLGTALGDGVKISIYKTEYGVSWLDVISLRVRRFIFRYFNTVPLTT
jgi:hypothetical protein